MAKHKRYSRKRSQRRNRMASRKMRGGVGEAERATLEQLGFNEEQITYLLQNHPNMDIAFFENSVNGVPGNIFFPEPQDPALIIQALQDVDADIDNANESLNTTREAMSQYSNNSLNNSGFSDLSSIQGDTSDNEIMDVSLNLSEATTTPIDESIGGKRRTLAKQNKRKTNKRKSKKSKKTRKHRKRRQYGGVGMTTTEEFSPVSYLDSMEESQTKMVTPFKQ